MIGIVIPTCSEGLTLLKKVNANLIYQDNNIGEIVRNYLQWSDTDRGII